jgi:hypothetical protein
MKTTTHSLARLTGMLFAVHEGQNGALSHLISPVLAFGEGRFSDRPEKELYPIPVLHPHHLSDIHPHGAPVMFQLTGGQHRDHSRWNLVTLSLDQLLHLP